MKHKGQGLDYFEFLIKGSVIDNKLNDQSFRLHDTATPLNELFWINRTNVLDFAGLSMVKLRYVAYKEHFNESFKPFKRTKRYDR